MKKLTPWLKNNIREVKHTWERYIAIFAIIGIGVAFFAGLVITRDAMVATIDKYLDDHNLYDYRLLSTLAFEGDDPEAFLRLDGVESSVGSITKDFLGEFTNNEQVFVLKAHSMSDEINKLQVIEGRLPEKDNETVLDSMYFTSETIGQSLKVSLDNDADTRDSFKYKDYTVVGLVRSPEYINAQRGTTSLANGSIDAFVYIPEDGFDLDYYTEIFLKLNHSASPYSDEYKDLIASKEDSIKSLLDKLSLDRYDKVIEEANEELVDAEAKYQDGYNEYLSEKEKALKELDDAYEKLLDGQSEIKENEKKLIEGENELAKGFKEYEDGLRKYQEGLAEFESNKASVLKDLEDKQKEIDENRAKVLAGITEIESSDHFDLIINYDEAIVANIEKLQEAKAQIEASGVIDTYNDLQDGLLQIEEGQKEIDANRKAIEAGLLAIENSEIGHIISQHGGISQAISHYEGLKSQFLELGGPLDMYHKLEEELETLNELDTSTMTEEELLEHEGIKAQIQTQMKAIEDTGVLTNFIQVDSLLNGLYQVNTQYSELLKGQEDLDLAQAVLDENKEAIEAGLKSINESGVINQYQEVITNLFNLEMAKDQIDSSGVRDIYKELQAALKDLDQGQAMLDEGLALANAEFAKAEKELENAKTELDAAFNKLESARIELEDGKAALAEGKAELDDGFAEYEDGKKEADEAFAEAEEELEDARVKIDDAKKEIADLKTPNTFIFDRSHNSGYSSFDNDSSIVAGIAKVLPIFFFFVAALVCSTTMARMVDEQRTQIGTLKALGFSDRKITNKYVSYSASAAIFGCLLGYTLGTKYFPMAIWVAYGMLYDFAPLEFIFSPYLAIISLVVSLVCSAGVTFITCKNELIQPPAELIRPKAPKPGKRILLERIPAIWNRLGFLRKVAIRNIFRFKKRLLMTVMGVAGCTALIIAALGIEDSVGNIANYQFDDIMNYDYELYFSEGLSSEDINDFNEKYSDILSDNIFIAKETFEIIKDNQSKSFNLIASQNENISNLIDFHMEGEKVAFPEDGQVLLSHKLASEFGVKVGDRVKIKISDTENVDAIVGGIFENYINHYMYMSENTYQTLFSKEAKYLNSYATTNIEDLDRVANELTNDEDIIALVSTQSIRSAVEDTMSSLNYVVWLVLGFALALAFVVVYNLNNINITERTREIATLKVLGFYPKETYVYVYRENIVLTGLGIIVGLILGKGLLTFIMNAIQVDFVTFKQQIFPHSYLVAIIVTFLLTILVNLILRNKIDYINMAESLNSGE